MNSSIQISYQEYESLKNALKKSEGKKSELNNKIENLEEQIGCYKDSFDYISHISFFERVFKWKSILKNIMSIAPYS